MSPFPSFFASSIPGIATARPRLPPRAASKRLSTSSCRSTRARLAPECGAHGDLLRTGGSPGEEKVCKIYAGYEQQEKCGRLNNEENGSRLADELFRQGQQRRAPAGI